MPVPDLETAIAQTVERAVKRALEEICMPSAPSDVVATDDEVLTVPRLAQYLGIGQRQAYQLVNCNPPCFPVKRVGTRILVLRDVVRRWLEAGGDAGLAPMSLDTRRTLEERRR
jgi:predicted DNA-binding transcriptional regulator AlpA